MGGAISEANRCQFTIVLSPQLLQANETSPVPVSLGHRGIQESLCISSSHLLPFSPLVMQPVPRQLPPLTMPSPSHPQLHPGRALPFRCPAQAIALYFPDQRTRWMRVSLGAPLRAACPQALPPPPTAAVPLGCLLKMQIPRQHFQSFCIHR